MARLGAAGQSGRIPDQHRAGPGRRGRRAAQRGRDPRAPGRSVGRARSVPARRPRARAAPSAQSRSERRVLGLARRRALDARFTSSRTLAFPGEDSGDALFSVKLATDHPHPSFRQPEKTKLRHEAIDAITWAWVLDRIDGLLGPIDSSIALLPEMLIVLVDGHESGFLVRDLRLFQDGHYYLPALSLPFVGRAIASQHGATFDAFWGRSFAEQVGRAKACLLARYGLWFETPNPQNLLLQLDRELRPTGRLVFRDMGDGDCATDAKEAREVPVDAARGRPASRDAHLVLGLRRSWRALDSGQRARALVRASRRGLLRELARWFPEIAPPPGHDRGHDSSTGTMRCAATRARRACARIRGRMKGERVARVRREARSQRAGSSAATASSQSSRPGFATSCTRPAARRPSARAAARSPAGRSRSRAR
jgi:hypothetical protein